MIWHSVKLGCCGKRHCRYTALVPQRVQLQPRTARIVVLNLDRAHDRVSNGDKDKTTLGDPHPLPEGHSLQFRLRDGGRCVQQASDRPKPLAADAGTSSTSPHIVPPTLRQDHQDGVDACKKCKGHGMSPGGVGATVAPPGTYVWSIVALATPYSGPSLHIRRPCAAAGMTPSA